MATAMPVQDGVRPITTGSSLLRRMIALFVVHAVLISGAVFILLPFVWMVVTSLKSPSEIFTVDFSLWPKQFNAVENYGRALTKVPLLLAVGDKDSLITSSRAFSEQLKGLKVAHEYSEKPGLDHGTVAKGAGPFIMPFVERVSARISAP